jgi:cytochrome c oxidase cbb3-type subunit 3
VGRHWLGLLLFWPLAAAAQTQGVVPEQTEKHELGRAVYNAECYFCHGYSGDARTLASAYLQPPPRNFVGISVDDLSPEEMLRAVKSGRPGTAMPGFSAKLSAGKVDAVVAFIREEFMRNKGRNARYHSAQNGWSPAESSEAIAFASGRIPIDTPWAALSPEQQRGKRLFLSSCVSCHDIGRINDAGPAWSPEAVSYPPGGYAHSHPQGDPAPVPYYERHERPPALAGLSPEERRGERLFQANCAACHAADGTRRRRISATRGSAEAGLGSSSSRPSAPVRPVPPCRPGARFSTTPTSRPWRLTCFGPSPPRRGRARNETRNSAPEPVMAAAAFVRVSPGFASPRRAPSPKHAHP